LQLRKKKRLKPLVSIIIPTYNRSHLLGETLDSVIEQTFKNWECLIIDDGSEDYTAELVEFYCEKDSRIQYHERPKTYPKGANSCRNFGFDISSGDFVNWFDSDDIMLSSFLEEKINSFSTSNIQFVVCGGYYIDENLQPIESLKMDLKYDLFKGLILGKQIIITDSVLFRRSFLKKKQLFNPKICRGEETEFFSRLFFKVNKQSYRVINKPIFLYRQHFGSKTVNNKNYVKRFKESTGYIAACNLKRSISINDSELILHYYKILVIHFFTGLENNHRSNSIFVFKSLLPLLWKINKSMFFEFIITGSLLLTLNKGSYRISKRYRENQLFKNTSDALIFLKCL